LRRLAESLVAAEETARILVAALKPPEPEGVIHPYREAVTFELPLLLRAVQPWWSIYVWNEGPDPVDTFINGREFSFRLGAEESRKIDLGGPLIRDVYVTVEQGASATVRIDAMR